MRVWFNPGPMTWNRSIKQMWACFECDLLNLRKSDEVKATNTPYYLRPLERTVHIGSSTNTWGPLKPSQMWNFDVVQARLKLNRFCPQLPGKHLSLGQRVPD